MFNVFESRVIKICMYQEKVQKVIASQFIYDMSVKDEHPHEETSNNHRDEIDCDDNNNELHTTTTRKCRQIDISV